MNAKSYSNPRVEYLQDQVHALNTSLSMAKKLINEQKREIDDLKTQVAGLRKRLIEKGDPDGPVYTGD